MNRDEIAVVRVLEGHSHLDTMQIAAFAALSPTRTDQAVKRLNDKHLATIEHRGTRQVVDLDREALKRYQMSGPGAGAQAEALLGRLLQDDTDPDRVLADADEETLRELAKRQLTHRQASLIAHQATIDFLIDAAVGQVEAGGTNLIDLRTYLEYSLGTTALSYHIEGVIRATNDRDS